ncbi:Dps family protein [uncultured Croceitalea sp.]|uniref:Dps family protein n=1 Tax=uncultured Croceitalea sp. TaxID=1798908 RepID=UPI00374F5CC5
MTLNNIGLKSRESEIISNKLNELLSNYQVFYMNARGFHWNIKGNKFFELHAKFEELYNESLVKIDEIAERILTLGFTPVHAYSDYMKVSKIAEAKNISEGDKAIMEILKGYEVLLPIERDLLELAGEHNDEGTSALMSDYIREQEKLIWMFNAYLNKD